MANKKLSEIALRDKYGLLIPAIMWKDSDEIIYSPPLDTILN